MIYTIKINFNVSLSLKEFDDISFIKRLRSAISETKTNGTVFIYDASSLYRVYYCIRLQYVVLL